MTENHADRGPWEEAPRGLGLVLDAGRGSLPYALIHGEALVACAAWALGEAGATLLDASVEWEALAGTAAETGDPVVLHDSLCPMTPPDFIVACVQRSLAEDAVVVATRPVTDTVKVVSHGLVGETVDRDRLRSVASPVVLPPSVVAALPTAPGPDLVAAVIDLARSHLVVQVEAPATARRVGSADDITLLAALTAG
ncbi:hypothetical protein EXE58_04620 [Nocardioides seonyuensis]|uniref:2-C-methyl-D-erythritol 4-phosphate cytidylyltransferase n=1 Tax=Nocardioides seonyuensis TaxID=2518371 RepID=A0A4P7ICI6_9ACTN|nr:hypothetical protein EXE58_04620 [Nocardioides seonyuensis]